MEKEKKVLEHRVAFRMADELFNKVSLEDNAGELVRELLENHYRLTPKIPKPKEHAVKGHLVATKTGKRALILPVGDILMKGQPDRERVELWWCPLEHVDTVVKLMSVFDGCSAGIGEEGNGTDYMPEIIQEEHQERKRNGCFTPSCRMDEALIGDKLIWMNIDDSEKAIKSFKTHTAVPCPIRIDVIRYNDDDRYKEACTIGNKLFTYYYKNTRPYDNSAIDTHTNVFNKLYDVD